MTKPTKPDEDRCKRHTVSLEPRYWRIIEANGGGSKILRDFALGLLAPRPTIDIVSPAEGGEE